MVLSQIQPNYTEEARVAKREGAVLLSLTGGLDGIPTDIKVIRPLGLELDEKAIEAVQKWRFRPGMRDGVPVSTAARVAPLLP